LAKFRAWFVQRFPQGGFNCLIRTIVIGITKRICDFLECTPSKAQFHGPSLFLNGVDPAWRCG